MRVLVLQLSLERYFYQTSFIWSLWQHGEGIGDALGGHRDVDHLVLQPSPSCLRQLHHLLEEDPPGYHVPLQLCQLHLLVDYRSLSEPIFSAHWWHFPLQHVIFAGFADVVVLCLLSIDCESQLCLRLQSGDAFAEKSWFLLLHLFFQPIYSVHIGLEQLSLAAAAHKDVAEHDGPAELSCPTMFSPLLLRYLCSGLSLCLPVLLQELFLICLPLLCFAPLTLLPLIFHELFLVLFLSLCFPLSLLLSVFLLELLLVLLLSLCFASPILLPLLFKELFLILPSNCRLQVLSVIMCFFSCAFSCPHPGHCTFPVLVTTRSTV